MRDEEGVILFRGAKDGEGADGIPAEDGVSGCGVGGVNGTGGALGIIDILLSLLASVGLIVRAASPVAWALFGSIDMRLLEGVELPCVLGLAGDCVWLPPKTSVCDRNPFGIVEDSCDFLGVA